MVPRDHDHEHDAVLKPAAEAAAEPLTVAAYLREWLAVQTTQVATSTWYGYRGIIERYLVPALGDVALDALDPMALNGFYVRLLVEGGKDGGPLAVATVRGCHSLLRKAYTMAVDTGLVATNPCVRATVPRRDPNRPEAGRPEVAVWTIEQLRTFLELARDDPLYDLWVLAAGTGMRRGELLALSWADVEADATLRVRASLSIVGRRVERKPTKAMRPRTICIDDQVVAALDRQRHRQHAERAAYGPAWHNPWDLVFTGGGGRHHRPATITTAFRELVASLPLPAMTLQGLRHTHASHLLSLKVPIKVVSHRLGHARVQITMDRYAHLLPGMDQAAVEAFSADLYGDDEAAGGAGDGGEGRSPLPGEQRPASHEEGENTDGST